MKKLLIGPALIGSGWLAGSYYGASAEQLVHKQPGVVYAAVERAVEGAGQSGMMQLEGGKPIPYKLKFERNSGERLIVRILLSGRQGAETQVDFIPQNGGKDTLMTARVHADRSVLRQALAGTKHARLAYAPDWMLNLTMRPLLQKLATEIEAGAPVGDSTEGVLSQGDWAGQIPPDQREQMDEWRQYEASRPTLDPDEAARNYLKDGAQ